MAKQLDVYRDWLGITDPARPLSYYALLKLPLFEDSVEKIRSNYRRLNAHVRKYATGEYGPQSQELLNELAKAMLCLTDAERKAEYDAYLGRKDKGQGRRRPLEHILLSQRAINQEQLQKARDFAKAVGLPIRDAVIQQRLAPPEIVMQAYAESEGLPYLDLDDVEVDPKLIARFPAVLARQHSCVPVMVDNERLLVASPNPINPDVEDEIRLRFGIPTRPVVCTPAGLNAAIDKYYARPPAQPASAKPAPGRRPLEQAEPEPLTPEERLKQRLVLVGLIASGSFLLYMVYLYYRAIFR